MGQQTVVGLFDNAADAQRAAADLQAAGFSKENFDVAARSGNTSASSGSGRDSDHYNASGTMVEGAADSVGRAFEGGNRNSGGDSDHYNASGTMVEGAADSVGRGLENVGDRVSNSNRTNSSGTLVEGAADSVGRGVEQGTSAIGRFFNNLFGDGDDDSRETASRYSRVAEQSGSIVTVHCHSDENARQAAGILDRAGAVDVDERASQYAAGNYNTATAGGQQSMKVIQEDIQVGKREVTTGGARLRSRIVERPVEESLRLREEHVFVNREAVNRPATDADFNAFKEGTIELKETAEVPVVQKEARVVEEVTLGKEASERTETIRDTVRSTEVDVERIDGTDATRRSAGGSSSSVDQ